MFKRRHRIKHLTHSLFGHTACILFTPGGTVKDASPSFLEAVGFALENIKGRHHRMLCPREVTESPEYKLFWDRLANGEHMKGTFHRHNACGEPLVLEATYIPLQDSSGRVKSVLKVANDVTHKVQKADADNAVLTALNTAMAVISFTPTGEIIDANDNFLAAVGYTLQDIQGQHHRILCPDYFYQQHPHFWEELAHGDFKQGKFERITRRSSFLP